METLDLEDIPLSRYKIAPLNCRFDVSSQEASAMWSSAVPMPPVLMPPDGEQYAPSPSRIKRTSNGQWVIRRQRTIFNGSEINAIDEFERLQDHGVNVISRAMVRSAGGLSVFTVSPWVTGLSLCDDATYEESVAPKLETYIDEATGRLALKDLLDKPWQFSTSPSLGEEPFLHDIDPYLKKF